jgi:phage gpG-like protein
MATEVVVDARQFRAQMARLGAILQSKEMTALIGMDVLAFVADQFRSEGRRGGLPWRRLAPSTIARRRRGGRGGLRDRILQDTGRLKQSFVRGGGGNVFRSGAKSIEVGTTIRYAPFHEEGTSRMPQRKILPTGQQAERIAVASIEAYIQQRTRNL